MRASRFYQPRGVTKATKRPRKAKKRILKKLRERPIRPGIGSLYDIMHDHAHASLYVPPLQWIDLHTKVLGCRFVQLPPYTTPTPNLSSTPGSSSSSQRSQRIPPTVASIGTDLNILMDATHKPPSITVNGEKVIAMGTLLSTLYPGYLSDPLCSTRLDLLFGPGCYPGAVDCQLLWYYMDPDTSTKSFDSATTQAASAPVSRAASYSMAGTSNSPVLAYVCRTQLSHARKHAFKFVHPPRVNGPTDPLFRLQAGRCKALIPKNTDEDAYILATMVTMAQQSVYTIVRSGAGFAPRDVKVRLITVAEDDDAFVVYTATVPKALLIMFHSPAKAPTGNSEVVIEHAHVPVWPVLGLKERLGKALGSDLVGEFDDTVMDTYEEELLPVAKTGSNKRGREVLSEVFNESFSEDSQYSTDSHPVGKKRRVIGKKGRRCSVTA